jgi:EmrB/QacA subfamily drug resistance transporter
MTLLTMTKDSMPRPEPYRGRWAALSLLLTAVFMDMVDNQIVIIALPTIQRDLGAAPSALQWTATGYTLAFALTLITGGRLGDRFGQRALFALGTAGFGVASLLAGAAWDVGVLLAARVAQGVFAGLMVPQVLAFIRAEFPKAEQGKAMGLFGMTFPIGGLAGPLLGGLLTQADLFGWHWRTIFLINVPIALAAAVGAALVMPAPRRPGRAGADVLGVLVLAATLLAVLYPLVQGRELGWPTWSLLLMAAAVPLVGLFVALQRARERGGREPLIRPGLFGNRAMPAGLLIMLIFYCGLGAFFVLTLHLQDGLGYSPLKTALTMLPATVGIVAGNGIGMPMAPRLGRRLPMIGLTVLLAGTVTMIAVVTGYGAGLTPWQLLVPVLLYGAGLGLGASSLMLITLTGAGTADAGAASGVVNTVVQLGTAAGPATVGTAFFGVLAAEGDYVVAMRTSLLIGLGLFAVALLACFLLPRPDQSSGTSSRSAVSSPADLSSSRTTRKAMPDE